MNATLSLVRAAWCTFAFVVPGLAQRTWIVDAAGGSGSHFTDLPEALAAANHGDQILLRPGSYRGASTDRGVTIIGPHANVETLRIIGLGANRQFALCGVTSTGWAPRIVCSDNAGRVHFDRVTVETRGAYLFPPGPAMEVTRCAAVTVTGCTLRGGPALLATRSLVVANDCDLTGADAWFSFKFGTPSRPAVVGEQATFVLARSRCVGGAAAAMQPSLPAAPALSLANCETTMLGGPVDLCRAGAAFTSGGANAIEETTGHLTIDPTLPIQPSGSGRPIVGGRVTMQRMPALLVRGATPGNQLTADVYAVAGDVAALFLDLPRQPVRNTAGLWWLDPQRMSTLDVGVVGAAQHRTTNVAVPDLGSLYGITVALQSATVNSPGGVLQASNPAIVVLH